MDLADHMRTLWQEIGFSPTTFQLPVETELRVDKSNEGDTTISENKSFRRQIERPELKEDDIKKIVGIQVRNLPPTLSDEEIVTFMADNVDKDITFERLSLFKNEQNLNVAIENGLEGSQVIAAAAKVEFRQSKQKFFGKPL